MSVKNSNSLIIFILGYLFDMWNRYAPFLLFNMWAGVGLLILFVVIIRRLERKKEKKKRLLQVEGKNNMMTEELF